MMDRLRVIDYCDNYWNPSAATLYHITHRSIEDRAEGSWIHDEEGRKFLDFACSYGVFIVGHNNSHVQKAVFHQLRKIGSRPYGMIDATSIKLMRKLAQMLPGDLNRVWLTNSGAEACELALRAVLASQYPRKKIVVAENSYHGKTLGALNILGQKNHRTPFSPLMECIEYVPYGDVLAMKKAIGEGVAAVFMEPILGGPYIKVPEIGYLKQVEILCKDTGSLLVADEIQTAFGRAGRMFAIGYDNVIPDMIILSKGLTGGHVAIAAMVMSERLYKKIEQNRNIDASYLASGSGMSPFSSAAALAAIDYIEEYQLPVRAEQLGVRLITGLKAIAAKYPKLILEVPGIALMTGLKVRNPAVETAITMVLGKMGIHVGHSMNESAQHPVLRFYPPLTVTEDEIDVCLGALDKTMKRLGSRPVFIFDLLNVLVRRQYRLPRWFLFRLTGVKGTT